MPSGDDFDSPLAFDEDANLELHLDETPDPAPVFAPDDDVMFNAAPESTPELHVDIEDTNSPIDFSPTQFDPILFGNPPDGYILEKTDAGAVWVNPSTLEVFDVYASMRTLDAVIGGRDGRDGWDGIPGERGPKGDQGTPGEHGWDGSDGRDGWDGPPGYKGDKGDTGATGPTGPAGADGLPGPPGEDGRKLRNEWDTYPTAVQSYGSFFGFANPSASVGLVAVPGSLATAMRSDAAPALDQSIVPTWTGVHTHQQSALATTPADAVIIKNPTAALVGAQVQYSPNLTFKGTAWNTSSLASHVASARMLLVPAAGNPITSAISFGFDANGGGYVQEARITSGGDIDAQSGFMIGGTAGSGQFLRGNGSHFAASAILAGDLPGSYSGFANPTASVGLTAVNGTATTAMRSDAAPALSQAIAPTWTAKHIFAPGAGAYGVQMNGARAWGFSVLTGNGDLIIDDISGAARFVNFAASGAGAMFNGYVGVGFNGTAPANVTRGDLNATRGHFGPDGAITTVNSIAAGIEAASSPIYLTGTLTTSTSNFVGFYQHQTLTGTGDGPQAAIINGQFVPSGSITNAYNFVSVASWNPASGKTITNAYSNLFYSVYGNVAGAVTTGWSAYIAAPTISGTLKPTTHYGLDIANQGASGITTSYGLHIAAQSGSTNNHEFVDEGHALIGTYLGVGSTSVPTNTTAGDITGTRLFLSGNLDLSAGITGSGLTWSDYSFNAADFTASGATWTVASGDITRFRYLLIGKTLFVDFAIDTTTLSAGTGTLSMKIPNGYTCSSHGPYHGFGWALDNGATGLGLRFFAAASATTMTIQRLDLGAFTACTDALYVQGHITLEIA